MLNLACYYGNKHGFFMPQMERMEYFTLGSVSSSNNP